MPSSHKFNHKQFPVRTSDFHNSAPDCNGNLHCFVNLWSDYSSDFVIVQWYVDTQPAKNKIYISIKISTFQDHVPFPCSV